MTRPSGLNVDLHSHSTASDGWLSPQAVAQRAADNGVQLWALTDHDELSGLSAARAAAESHGIQFISGVEVSVTWANRTVHIVGLNVDERNVALYDGLAYIRQGRIVRAQAIADKLEQLGIANAYDGALAYVSNPELISRTHFARFLVDKGYSPTINDVFKRYLGDGKPAYVPMQWATLDEAVTWITQAGGKAVIAHPGRYEFTALQFEELFRHFKEAGGVGIEVITGSHRSDQYATYAQVARRFGFEVSCGSDFHGPGKGRLDIGCLPPTPADLATVWQDWLTT